jgi:Ser-tRNA(Ala) deacylase AlaX
MTEKNYDPQMHSAEHILNGTMVKLFSVKRSFTNHLEKKKSKCDYYFDRDLTEDEKALIQQSVNEVISQNLEVFEEYIDRSIAEKQFDLSKLPSDAGDSIRIIRVGDYDACPCIGPHVSNTKEIGNFILNTTSWEEGVLRLRFKLA